MQNPKATLLMLLASLILGGCSTFSNLGLVSPSKKVEPYAGPRESKSTTIQTASSSTMENKLDKYDQEKMSHALDKPLGKATEWSNPKTGTNYTVTPLAKATVNGNSFCRKYSIASNKNGTQRDSKGTACVSATDSSWQIVN